MNRILWLLLFAAWTASASAQGTVVFNNRNIGIGLDAPIVLSERSGLRGPGTAYSAGLYYMGALVPGSVTTFRGNPDGPEPALAKYIVPLTVAIPGTEIEQRNVPVQVRIWLTAAGSYEAASPTARGSSGDVVIEQLGGGINPDVKNHLPVSFTGVVFFISPEPSTWALGVIGAVCCSFPAGVQVRRWRSRVNSGFPVEGGWLIS